MCLEACGTVCEAAQVLSAVRIKLRAGHNDPVPRPTAKRTAHWERWEPQIDFYPRTRKEWDNIARKSRSCKKNGQVHGGALRTLKAEKLCRKANGTSLSLFLAWPNSLGKNFSFSKKVSFFSHSVLQENCLRSSRRRILPEAVLGTVSMKCTSRGCL